MGLAAKSKTVVQCIEDALAKNDDELDAVDCIEPLAPSSESRHFVRLMRYLERRDIQPGEVLLEENQKVEGLYFIEEGQVIAQIENEAGQMMVVRVLTAGTVFGDIGIYTQQPATASIIVTEPGYLCSLSPENLLKAEKEDPELAIAFHRFIASGLGEKLTHSNDLVRALRG